MSQSEQTGAVSRPPAPSLVVGIGASAGGVEALQAFFSRVPADSGCAYAVILHLSPEYESNLATILQNVTPLPVTALRERTLVEPNHVYVVSPSQNLTMLDSFIAVTPTTSPAQRRAPVDLFFRTLADSHESRGVCVILSGSGSDGSLGLKQVKERGGAVFVQQPDEAFFAEMPRSAIATDLVDAVLPVAEIPARIVAYAANAGRTTLSEEPGLLPATQEQALHELVALLRARTGHDFSAYKRPTLFRRIERRIAVHTLPDLPAYAAFLRDHPEETQALLKDLLISVTTFFRDHEAFAALKQEVIPHLFAGKGSGDTVRVWVVGCATGEEAYSLAMLCAEHTRQLRDAPRVQIFATDIDEAALARARAGVYTATETADISPERLQRFFIEEQGRYRVRPELRELILFASHNLLADPPFSQLDLVSCRNLLIYFERGAQERLLETFHFALRPDGVLFLGSAEMADSGAGLFATINREQRLFRRRSTVVSVAPPLGSGVLPTIAPPMAMVVTEELERVRERLRSSELHRLLLEQYGPPSLVVTTDFALVHLSERAGRYLQLTGGEPTNDLLALIRPELRVALRNALFQAVQQQTPVEVPNLSVRVDERTEQLTLLVRPTLHPDTPNRGFLLVLFEPEPQAGSPRRASTSVLSADEQVLRQLEEETQRLRQQLRFSAEQYEVQTEELKAANEELEALNEELRTAAEEQTTSREELQSINEELRSLNQELKVKVEEAVQASANLHNLVNATNIATIFLDRQLRVRLFTPAARSLFNLIPLDQGRPLADITDRLQDVNVLADAEQVFATLQTVEREVRDIDGRAYVLRVLPYRVGDDRIGGVVLTFFDITERKRRERQQKFLLTFSDHVRTLSDEQTIEETGVRMLAEFLRLDRAYVFVLYPSEDRAVVRVEHRNENLASLLGAVRMSDFPETVRQIEDQTLVVNDIDSDTRLSDVNRTSLDAVNLQAFVCASVRKGERNVIWSLAAVSATPRTWTTDEIELIETVAERMWAAAERAKAEAALRESESRLRALVENLPGGAAFIVDRELRYRLAEGEALHAAGFEPRDYLGKTIFEALPPDLAASYERLYRQALAGEAFEHEHTAHDRSYISRGIPLRTEGGEVYAVLAVSYEITRKRTEEALRASEARFRTLSDVVPQLIWTNDAAGNAIYFNQRWYAYSGLSYDQSAGKGWQAIVHPDDEAGAVERWYQAVSSGTLFETEYRLRGADGSYCWHLGRNVPLRNENGAIIGWFGSATDIEAMKQAEAARQESAVLRRLAEAQEEERLRIARDLHDQLGQQITGLLLGLKQLEGPVRGTSAAPLLAPLQELALDLAKESHRIAVNLRPTALEDVGLIPALERLVARWSEQTGIPAGFESMGFDTERLPRPVEVALFRVVQEALTNVGKHAEATNASVLVERRADQISVIVEDNGRGFAVDAPAADERPHLGVLGMRERVAQVGGTLEIESSPGSGTTIFVRIPREPSGAKP